MRRFSRGNIKELKEIFSSQLEKDFHEIQRAIHVSEGATGEYNEKHALQTYPSWVEGELQHFVLREGSNSIATVSMAPIKNNPLAIGITFVAVALDQQKTGNGRKLLEAVESRALASGARKICLNAAPTAARFYKSCGYRQELWDQATLTGWPDEAGDPPIQYVKDVLE